MHAVWVAVNKSVEGMKQGYLDSSVTEAEFTTHHLMNSTEFMLDRVEESVSKLMKAIV